MPIEPGLTGRADLSVTDADTAIAFGSGDVPVLATPRLVALCEEATCCAIDGHLAETDTTVGVDIAFRHLAASKVGAHVVATATVRSFDGRTVAFDVEAGEGDTTIARGQVVRVVVDRERFLGRQESAE